MPLPLYSKKNVDKPSQEASSLDKIKIILAVASGKGGVGKSTVAVNLALSLHALGASVGLLDADIYGPSLTTMLPEDCPPSPRGTKVLPARCRGISMMSIDYFSKKNKAAAVRAPVANALIRQFLFGVEWGSLDVLLIDFPPGTGDIQLTLAQQAHLSGAIVVTTPQEIALIDVRKAMSLFDQVKVPMWGIVENMAFCRSPSGELFYPFGQGGGQRLSAEWNVPLWASLPLDPIVGACVDKGESLLEHSQGIESASLYKGMAEKILRQMKEETPLPEVSIKMATFIHSSQDSTERGKAGSKRSGLNEELMAKAMGDEEDRSGKAAAGRVSDECMKVAIKTPWLLSVRLPGGEEVCRSFADLQRECPCARCAEGKSKVLEDVQGLSLTPVGRYGFKVAFSSGCSEGIYNL